MRIIGLDVGDKTVGIAISDELGWTAQPVTVIRRVGGLGDIQAIREVIEEYEDESGLAKIVVGLPRNMDGSLGPMAEKVAAFGSGLAKGLGLEVEFWDERLSTVSAERVLIEADVSRKKRKTVVDKVAATIILQNYLDSRRESPGDRDR